MPMTDERFDEINLLFETINTSRQPTDRFLLGHVFEIKPSKTQQRKTQKEDLEHKLRLKVARAKIRNLDVSEVLEFNALRPKKLRRRRRIDQIIVTFLWKNQITEEEFIESNHKRIAGSPMTKERAIEVAGLTAKLIRRGKISAEEIVAWAKRRGAIIETSIQTNTP